MRAPLAILIPTYDRAALLDGLLANMAAELGGREDVPLLVADNASPDATAAVLDAWCARLPTLDVQRQPSNLGAVANARWLVANAPDAAYVWLIGDDDRLEPGAIAAVLELLQRERPAWLHLPHRFVNADGQGTPSPCPAQLERFSGAGPLYERYHHWLTFISAQVLQRDALASAVRDDACENPFAPLVWFVRAALARRCVVADRALVVGSDDVSWRETIDEYMTRHYVALFDDALHLVLDRATFGMTLDRLYGTPHGLGFWRGVGVQELAGAVARFPHSTVLRGFLWTLAREHGRRDALDVLSVASRTAGCEREARELVAAGEERFSTGDVPGALRAFQAAVERCPTYAPAWNDLGVARHALGHPGAADAIGVALELDAAYADAQANLAEIAAG